MNTPSIDQLVEILQTGQVSSLCDTCCPCSNVYFFGGVEEILQFMEAVTWPEYSNDCTGNPNSWYSDCCTKTCFEELSEFLGAERTNVLLDVGIVEYSLLGNKSTLCLLYDYIIENDLSQDDALELITSILNTGIVFFCQKVEDGSGDVQVLSSVEKFLQYLEVELSGSVNIIPPFCSFSSPPEDICQCYPQEGCCLTIKASVESYIIWNEFIN